MNPARTPTPDKGEILKLGPPAAGEVVITVDPSRAGTSFAAGTETLLPRAEIPVHKHLEQDEVLFIHKGQGRAVLGEQSMLVLPGTILHVPRGAWHGLRNTGTGALQLVWLSSPPGFEVFVRELSRLGPAPTMDAIQELAQRHKIELRPATGAPMPPAAPSPTGHRHRGRRGGRRHRGSGRAPTPAPASAHGSAPAPAPLPSSPRPALAAAAPVPPPSPSPRPSPAPKSPTPSIDTGRSRPPRGHHRRRVKEVYMGGRWVRVEGEGPVIAPSPQESRRRVHKPGSDDEPSPIR